MYPRHITSHLERLAAQFPVVTVPGPRQSGKTTLVRTVFPDYEYLNLELPPLRLEAQSDALGFSGRTLRHWFSMKFNMSPNCSVMFR